MGASSAGFVAIAVALVIAILALLAVFVVGLVADVVVVAAPVAVPAFGPVAVLPALVAVFVVVLALASFSRFVAGSENSNHETQLGVVELPNIALVGVVEEIAAHVKMI